MQIKIKTDTTCLYCKNKLRAGEKAIFLKNGKSIHDPKCIEKLKKHVKHIQETKKHKDS